MPNNALAYTVEELAQASKVGRTLIYAEIKNGALRVVKLGRRTVITRTAAEAWLESRSKTPKVG